MQNQTPRYTCQEMNGAYGYRWDARNKVWQKSFLEDGFSVDTLQQSIWSPLANEINVQIVDEHESLLGEYAIISGQWNSLRNHVQQGADVGQISAERGVSFIKDIGH